MPNRSLNAAFRAPPPSDAPRLIAERYRLERLLGEGGMGSVWMARNVMLDLPVALKIVRPEARGQDTCERLLMEARVEASLAHPNVVRVFDCGITEDGDAFIVMELLEGCSLGDLLYEQGALRPEFAVQLLLPVIHALSTAHQAGIVHRDLKPDNIFISRTGGQLCPKILDFGIAKFNAHDGRSPALHKTGRGMVMGSPAYMAPEQVRGLPDLDARADVWAMTVVLYEALTGKMAFDADNYNAVLCEVLERELTPLTDPDRSDLWPILQRGLAKDRARRIGSLRELGTLLANWLTSRGVTDDASGEALSRNWQLGGPTRNAVAAPPMPDLAASTMGRGIESGVRSAARTECTVRVETRPSRLRGQPGAIGLGVCLTLQLLLLGSTFNDNWRESAPRTDAAQNATPAPNAPPEPRAASAQAATLGPNRAGGTPTRHSADPLESPSAAGSSRQLPSVPSAPSAPSTPLRAAGAVALVSPPSTPEKAKPTAAASPTPTVSSPETETTRVSAPPEASEPVRDNPARKREPRSYKRVYAPDRSAPEESVLGLKHPW
jgi:eukaryotic-like serine/threonine-protein kinase